MNWLVDRFLHRFVSGRSSIFVGGAFWGLVAITYMLAGYSPIYEPQRLPLLPLEDEIPLVPWTVWIYLSDIPLILIGFLVYPRHKSGELMKYIKTGLFIQLAALLSFLLFPTCLAPQANGVPDNAVDIHDWALRVVKIIDHPTNCLPSLHVAFCFFSALVHWNHSKKWFGILLIWTIAVIVSTLTMKQHYVLDGVTGLMLTFVFYAFVFHGPLDPARPKRSSEV